jgi:hypothetical protein
MIRLSSGGLLRVIMTLIITFMSHENQLAMWHDIFLRTDETRTDLDGAGPMPLKMQLVDRRVLTWFDLNTLEARFRVAARALSFEENGDKGKRLERAERGARYGLHGQGDRCYVSDGSPRLLADSIRNL